MEWVGYNPQPDTHHPTSSLTAEVNEPLPRIVTMRNDAPNGERHIRLLDCDTIFFELGVKENACLPTI